MAFNLLRRVADRARLEEKTERSKINATYCTYDRIAREGPPSADYSALAVSWLKINQVSCKLELSSDHPRFSTAFNER